MKEYKISFTAGTSPYWYNKSFFAYSADEALAEFSRSEFCPYNVREIKVEEI